MVLLGDPAVSLFSAGKPDYEINNTSISVVSLDGRPVTALSESFAVDVLVRNFGRAQPGVMQIKISRTISDNSVIVYDTLVDPVLYSNVVRFVIRKGRNDAEFGSNNFTVSIDPDNKIGELNEANNKGVPGGSLSH
ncbi:MAG: CARDB domain-containing protein [Bacteroidota bacterium]